MSMEMRRWRAVVMLLFANCGTLHIFWIGAKLKLAEWMIQIDRQNPLNKCNLRSQPKRLTMSSSRGEEVARKMGIDQYGMA